MNAEEQLLLQIDRYLRNEMDTGEQTVFEAQMNDDASLKNRVEEFRQLDSLLHKDLFRFRQRLDAVEEELAKENFFSDMPVIESSSSETVRSEVVAQPASSPQVEPGPVVRMRYAWAVAAAIALLIGAFWFFNRPADMQQLAMNAARNDFGNVRGDYQVLDSLFDSGNFDLFISESLYTLNDSEKTTKTSLVVNTARAYVIIDKPEEAISLLSKLSDEEKKDCSVQYALALSNLSANRKPEAVELLQKIVDDKCYPYDSDDKSKFLIEQLK